MIGFWIWLSDKNIYHESHVFFRRDFTLDALPQNAEIWITARSAFHLFINGRHCTAGPLPSPKNGTCYVCHVNADYMLQLGTNQIAIQVFNNNRAAANGHKESGGVWFQMNMDGEPFLWTDEYWMGLEAAGYIDAGIFQTPGGVNVEMVNFKRHPPSWNKEPFTPFRKGIQNQQLPTLINAASNSKYRWRQPDTLMPLEAGKYKLELAPNCDDLIQMMNWQSVVSGGKVLQQNLVHWVNFRRHTVGRLAGTFVAETYIYSEEARPCNVQCHCNRPYRLFLNEGLLKEQAIHELPVCAAISPRGDKPLAPGECVPCDARMNLQQGWNRLYLIIDCASSGHGMTIVFEDIPLGMLKCHCNPDESCAEGWTTAGPISTPFAMISPWVPMPDIMKNEFVLQNEPAWDMAVIQNAMQFMPDEKKMEDISTGLQQGSELTKGARSLCSLGKDEYVIFDFGKTIYGYPVVSVCGNDGDIVDVVCGEHLIGNRVVAYTGTRRNFTVLHLDGRKHDRWIASLPQGFRYIMVQVRAASESVQLENIHARFHSHGFAKTGQFESGYTLLNQIWQTGINTLEATMHGHYLDAPAGEQTQYIADAMIQAWAGFHVMGGYSHSANALKAFASTQFETGEINSACPSGFFQVLPDFSLLWIIWLHRHYTYTGDKQLLKELMPAAERLLAYFNSLAIADDGPIGDLQEYLGSLPFLDQDPAIVRSGISTGLNAIYNRALLYAAFLEEELGYEANARMYAKRSASLAAYMRTLAWNKEKSLFADSYDNDTQSAECSWQTNILAMYGALADTDQYESIWELLFRDDAPYTRFNPGEFENPYFKFYVGQVAFALGKTKWMTDVMCRYWGGMLEEGATTWWELFSPEIKHDTRLFSRCHGYGTSPNGFMISELAGFRPAEPGMKKVIFAPALLDELPWVKVIIPTVHGTISAEWHRKDKGLDVSINSTYPLEIIPALPPDAELEVTFNLGDNVNVAE